MGWLDTLEQSQLEFSDDIEAWTGGQINAGELALRAAGETGEVFGAIVGTPVEKAIDALPEYPKELVAKGADALLSGAKDSTAGRWLLKRLEENPRAARNLGSVWGAIDLLPAAAVLKGGGKGMLNAISDQTRTDMPGFYSGDPLGAFSKAVAAGLPEAGKSFYSPTSKAYREQMGTGKTRVKEVINAEKEGTRRGSIMASGFMGMQQADAPSTGSLIENLPTAKAEVKGVTRASDTGQLKELLKSDYDDVPDSVADNFMNTSVDALGSRPGNVERVSSRVSNVGGAPDPKNALVVVRDKGAPGSALGAEAMGSKSTTGRVMGLLRNKSSLPQFRKAYGVDKMGPAEYSEFIRTAKAFERGNWMAVQDKFPKGQTATYNSYLAAVKNKMDGKELKGHQREVYETMHPIVQRQQAPRVGDDGLIYHTGNFLSSAQDLGGVGYKMALDPETGAMYSMVIDGHDMFGMDPAGGAQLWNMTPIQKSYVEGVKADIGTKTAAVTAREKAAIKKIEQMTGLVREPKETIRAFEQRALETFQPKVSAKHRAQAASNVANTGVAAINTQREEENQ